MLDKVMTKNDAGDLVERELPTFHSFETVRAAKIMAIAYLANAEYRLSLEGGAHVDVTKNWVGVKHPLVGGYYVQQQNGSASFVSADDFEATFGEDLPTLAQVEEAQGSGSERNGAGDWTEAGDGTGYPQTATGADLMLRTQPIVPAIEKIVDKVEANLAADQKQQAEPDVITELEKAPPAPEEPHQGGE